jgi:uncharacterized membrane protein
MERHVRTVLKTLSWRIFASVSTMILVYFFTSNLVISASVSLLELVVKTVIYYLHERLWNRITFGREYPETK